MNKVHHRDWLDNRLPDKCAKLIIMDPPYFEVKGHFDFVWETFDDYLADVDRWAVECKRVLAANGTLLWYGDRKKIAYSQIILDKYFNLEACPVVHFLDRQTKKTRPEDARSFINVTERVLMYSNETTVGVCKNAEQNYRFQIGNARTRIMEPIIGYLMTERDRAGFTNPMINEGLRTSMSSHWFARTSQWEIPTPENYARLQQLFNGEHLRREYEHLRREYEDLRREYEDLRREYEDLRREYEDLRRHFHAPEAFKTDVLRVSQEAHLTGQHKHDTCKPPTLSRVLISSTTKRGDLVVVPMAGSGTECEAAAELGRPFHGFDVMREYVDMSNNRVNKVNLKLF